MHLISAAVSAHFWPSSATQIPFCPKSVYANITPESSSLAFLVKPSSLKTYELNAGNRSKLQLKNTQENFVFESLWHVIFGKALVCIKVANF